MTSSSNPFNQTPMAVRPRKMAFPYQQLDQQYFFDNNALKSVYIAALSATFPAGEGEFINSVRLFQDQVDDEMRTQIRGFIGQEAHHSKQHKAFNRALASLGFDAVRTEKVFEKDLAGALKNRSSKVRLAFTVCFEHQTAILAHEFFTNPDVLKGMHPAIAQLLRWHAVEEIEHKSVAFDLYMQCVGDRKLLHKVQRRATFIFTLRTYKYMCLMLWWSRTLPKWRDIKGFARFMFAKGGLLRSLHKPYRDFFRKDFHPWDHDDAHLVEQWKRHEYQAQYDNSTQKVA